MSRTLCIHASIQLILILLLLPIDSLRAEADEPCPDFKSYKDILSCALKVHPYVKQAEISREQGESLQGIASQIPNPELSTQSVLGFGPSAGGYSFQIDLAHTFELGGKRSSRQSRAKAQTSFLASQFLGAQEKTFLQTLEALHRLRQIQTELRDIYEALTLFRSVKAQYQALYKLNPEQKATLSILEIAEGEYDFRKLPLESEIEELNRFLEIATGKPFQTKPHLLPQAPDKWPELQMSHHSTLKSSKIKSAEASLQFSQASLELSQSEAWPNLRLGPSVQFQNQFLQQFNAAGINLSLALPIYHLNGAAIYHAKQELDKSEILVQQVQKETHHELEINHKRYVEAVKELKETPTINELDEKQISVEQLFKRGVISGSMIIELHRQLIELTIKRNQTELAALSALVRIYAIQGKLFEADL